MSYIKSNLTKDISPKIFYAHEMHKRRVWLPLVDAVVFERLIGGASCNGGCPSSATATAVRTAAAVIHKDKIL
jgi:hypothetical protein